MRKLGLIGVVVLSCAGCGHGWLPFRPFQGAMCRDNCVSHAHCDGCSGAAGYPSYADEGVVSDSYIGGTTVAPPTNAPMAPLPGRP